MDYSLRSFWRLFPWEERLVGNAGNLDPEEVQRLETRSVERRKLIGQAIIDGLLDPEDVAAVVVRKNYNQTSGDYTQSSGNHLQTGGGSYNQSN